MQQVVLSRARCQEQVLDQWYRWFQTQRLLLVFEAPILQQELLATPRTARRSR